MNFVVEDGVPMPRSSYREPAPLVAALRKLQIGQSIFVPGRTAKNVCHSLESAKRKTDMYFSSRTMSNGVRIWRLE